MHLKTPAQGRLEGWGGGVGGARGGYRAEIIKEESESVAEAVNPSEARRGRLALTG